MRVPGSLADPLRLFADVFRNSDLRRLELAWAASNLASRASAIAIAVFAYESDGVGAVGLVAFARLATGAAASPWLGVLVDRLPRRRVLVIADFVRALLLGAMAGLAALEVAPAVYVLAVIAALAEPLFRSAQVAFTPSLVRTPEELTAANVLASGVESIGLFIGPALGAALLVVTGSGTVLAVTAGLSLLSVALVSRISIAGERPEPESDLRSHVLLGGWHAIAADRSLRVVIGLFSAQTFVAGMVQVLVVVLAIELLELGTAGVGWLNGMIGIGATLGVVAVAGIAGRRRLAGIFTVGLLLWGVPLLLVAAWPETAPALVLLALVGVGNTLVDVTGITLMQRAADDAVLGRVFGAFEAIVLISMALGSLVTPALVAALGTRGAVLVAGAILPILLVPLWRPLASVDAAVPVPRERIELLRGVPIFAPLPPQALERLAEALVETAVEAAVTVFEQGDHGDLFYVVADGRAVVELDGRSVRELGPGEGFGEIALLHDVPRTATVRALTPLRLCALDREIFLSTVAGDPASAAAAGSIVAARLPGPVIN